MPQRNAPTAPDAGPPPPTGASAPRLLAWIQAGRPAAAERYHAATADDGTVTRLEDPADVGFTTPSGKITCMTALRYQPALNCLVWLLDAPPKPAGVQGEWIGGWVTFDGDTATVGSLHGDPGPFIQGRGPTLPYGQTLSFGDFRCRSDQSGLFCVDESRQTGLRYASVGIDVFGCLHQVSPRGRPDEEPVGLAFQC
jgi:hypothetical protein